MKKVMRRVAVLALMALVFGAVLACKNDSDDDDKSLPGTKGGSGNELDVWAGKTFYDNSNADYADEKYVFADDGTFVMYENDDEWLAEQKFEYSLSDDGTYAYARVIGVAVGDFGEEGKLYTYSEISSLLSQLKAMLKMAVEADSDYKEMMCYMTGLSTDASADKVVSEYINFSKKVIKEQFDAILTFKIDSLGAGEKSYVLTEQLPSATNLPALGLFHGTFRDNESWCFYVGAGRYFGSLVVGSNVYSVYTADKTYLYTGKTREDYPNNLTKFPYTLTCADGSATLKVTVAEDDVRTLTYGQYKRRLITAGDTTAE